MNIWNRIVARLQEPFDLRWENYSNLFGSLNIQFEKNVKKELSWNSIAVNRDTMCKEEQEEVAR